MILVTKATKMTLYPTSGNFLILNSLIKDYVCYRVQIGTSNYNPKAVEFILHWAN